MLSHAQVWAAIDGLARRYGLSPSGLAKRAGLDPTTFNPSKRFATDGRPRWPSTESLSKILEATGEPLDAFVGSMMPEGTSNSSAPDERRVPLAGLRDVDGKESFDRDGAPFGEKWDLLTFPEKSMQGLFAIKVEGDSMMPLYRDGEVLIIARNAPLRRGDRVVVKPREASLSVMFLRQRTDQAIEFDTLDQKGSVHRMPHSDIDWVARVIWVSQ